MTAEADDKRPDFKVIDGGLDYAQKLARLAERLTLTNLSPDSQRQLIILAQEHPAIIDRVNSNIVPEGPDSAA